MGRQYYVPFSRQSVTLVQDLFEVLGSADSVLELVGISLSQDTDAGDSESEQLAISVRRVTGSPISGSAGSTVTPVPVSPGDAAYGGVCEVNNTTQLSGGTNTVIFNESFNVMAGMYIIFPKEVRVRIVGATRLLVDLEVAPADGLIMSGYLIIEEID